MTGKKLRKGQIAPQNAVFETTLQFSGTATTKSAGKNEPACANALIGA